VTDFRALCTELVVALGRAAAGLNSGTAHAGDRAAWAHEAFQTAARAESALAQPAPPAEGEVGELVNRLRRASDGASAMGWEQDAWTIARAAPAAPPRARAGERAVAGARGLHHQPAQRPGPMVLGMGAARSAALQRQMADDASRVAFRRGRGLAPRHRPPAAKLHIT
jgi:hypothetical protein